jgi:hypothetical protein
VVVTPDSHSTPPNGLGSISRRQVFRPTHSRRSLRPASKAFRSTRHNTCAPRTVSKAVDLRQA